VTAAIAFAAPAPAVSPESAALWWARITRRGADPVEHSLVAVNSDRFPAGTPVDLSALDARGRRPAGWLVDVRYRACDGAVVRIDVADTVAEPGLPIWFTETHHAGASIPTVTLTACTGGPTAPGALVPPRCRGTGPQLGSIRWQLRSGLVEGLTVAAPYRGQRIGRLLAVAADGLRCLRGWPALHADGRLTDPAADWLAASPAYWRPRLTARTHHLADVDPEAPTGVERLLADLPSRLL
jgi:hypothetical protein